MAFPCQLAAMLTTRAVARPAAAKNCRNYRFANSDLAGAVHHPLAQARPTPSLLARPCAMGAPALALLALALLLGSATGALARLATLPPAAARRRQPPPAMQLLAPGSSCRVHPHSHPALVPTCSGAQAGRRPAAKLVSLPVPRPWCSTRLCVPFGRATRRPVASGDASVCALHGEKIKGYGCRLCSSTAH